MFFKMSLRFAQTIKCGCNKSGSYLHRITMRLLYREKMLHPDVWREKTRTGVIATLGRVMSLRAVGEIGHEDIIIPVIPTVSCWDNPS